jgi:class 3 adenylate cyclase/tetratricopeptide (TPR) repeat protein
VPVCASCGRESEADFAFCPHCGSPFAQAPAAREQRKVVTVLFCDVTGSTELGEKLDPEALRALLARYFDRMKAIVERHGGSVEKFIGDAVMAVFGVPTVHEDDALRALRAAVEMRDVFPELGIEGRIGVTSGEVVTGTEERLATGDPVNVAARLEQTARPGEILIGEETFRLARDAADVEAVEPLALKGKAERLPAYRLLSVHGAEGITRRLDAPMVGREREQRLLADAWERVVSERTCQLFTVLGTAGVGKSRLAAEFLASLDEAAVFRGRCLPYGEGITYWPVVEVVKQLPDVDLDPIVAETIRAVAGDEQIVTSTEEIAWAFRKLLEAVAAERPLVCAFDDVHWGEETFLDLVEHVADLSRDAPILLLCMARPDLLDRRAGWAGGKVNATTVLLEPLGPEETERLIESLAPLDATLRDRIREAAEGNPLFVEEMVAMVEESPGRDVAVPPTIQALLAARLDQLDAPERTVIERGAVEGRVFHRGAVQALAPEEPQVTARLTSLVRKELVRPDKAQLPGEDAFRFRHLLIRDAAYDGLPKATRAELHERFATWLEEHGADLVELDEIVGYHLEQAAKYRAELGTPDDALAERASARLAAAGHRAELRGDLNAALNLLERGFRLRAGLAFDVELALDLADNLFWSGRLAEAQALLREAVTNAEATDDVRAVLRTRLAYQEVLSYTEPEGTMTPLRELAEDAIPVFEAAGDDRGLMEAWSAIGQVEHVLCRFAARNDAMRKATEYAGRAGDERAVKQGTGMQGPGYVFGPAPVEEALAWYASEAVERLARSRPSLLGTRAVLEAMAGRFEDARRLLVEMVIWGEELGQGMTRAHLGEFTWYVETRAGDRHAAEQALRDSCRQLEQMGERGWYSTTAGELGHVLCELGCYDEAEEWAHKGLELGAEDDIITQMYWRQVMAKVHAHRGELEEAERLAREAVAFGEPTDILPARGLAHLDLAEVLDAAGRAAEAATEVRNALAFFEQKGDIPMVDQARAHLQRLL